MKQNAIFKKIGNIATYVLLGIFIACALISVVFTVSAKPTQGDAATIFGMQMRLVRTNSMEKCPSTDVSAYEIKDIPTNSMVFIQTIPTNPNDAQKWLSELKVGDVITFKYVYTRQITITHRLTAIEEKSTGGYILSLEADNKGDAETALIQTIDTSEINSPNYVIGKVTGQSYLLGLLITVLTSTLGMIMLVIVPSAAIAIYEAVKMVNIIRSDKKEEDAAQKKAQEEELSALRQRIAELEEIAKAQTPNAHNNEDPKQ